jgi:hypothetical protein
MTSCRPPSTRCFFGLGDPAVASPPAWCFRKATFRGYFRSHGFARLLQSVSIVISARYRDLHPQVSSFMHSTRSPTPKPRRRRLSATGREWLRPNSSAATSAQSQLARGVLSEDRYRPHLPACGWPIPASRLAGPIHRAASDRPRSKRCRLGSQVPEARAVRRSTESWGGRAPTSKSRFDK